MPANIRALGKPTIDEAEKTALLKLVETLKEMVETGQIAAIVAIPIKLNGDFRVLKHGNLTRITTVGYLAQAQHDLLTEDVPA